MNLKKNTTLSSQNDSADFSLRSQQGRSNLIKDHKLYVIICPKDAKRLGVRLDDLAFEAAQGGADIIQIRGKDCSDRELLQHARRLKKNLARTQTLLIINDCPNIAALSDADGVHLGQDDMSIADARKIIGKGKIIGKSTHSLKQAQDAQEEGADYLGFGPIFQTPTKPDYTPVGLKTLREISKKIQTPFFAIGGINHGNCHEVMEHGATRIAVVRAATDKHDVKTSVSKLKHVIATAVSVIARHEAPKQSQS
jgi:thiamine-phosphate pyrophosphorylase